MERKINRYLYWTPRILSILFILFLAMFSLEVITPEASFSEIAMGLLIHNIPSLVLLIVLIISWKYEIVGGIVFILAGLLYIIFTFQAGRHWYVVLNWSLTIAGPAFLIGILFMINWFKKKQQSSYALNLNIKQLHIFHILRIRGIAGEFKAAPSMVLLR
jgi:hypothetical protein